MRSDYRTVVTWPRRGDGERAAYNLARLRASWDGRRRPAVLARHAARRLHRRRAQPGRHPRAPALPPPPRRAPAERVRRAGAAPCARSPTCAPATSSSTRTTASRASPASTRRPSPDVTRDYLELEYAGTDRVFMPVDQLAKITRYVGAGGSHPPLSKLGGKAWEAMKARARRAAQELAGELLNLYAERRRRPGHAFPEDGEWLREFEARFPYQETADQREAIEHVKADMERAAADGPPDLRRRRLRQDGGRAARRVQGRRRRQAGARAGADDDPRPAALRHLLRAPEGLPLHHRARQPLPLGQGAEGRHRRLQRRAASTSSSAPTACSAATCAARTSG